MGRISVALKHFLAVPSMVLSWGGAYYFVDKWYIARLFLRDYEAPETKGIGDHINYEEIEDEIQNLIADRKFRKACESAYKAHRQSIQNYCFKMMYRHVREYEAEAEELAQEVFYEFLRSLRRGRYERSNGSVHQYLLGIARHCITNKLRTLNRGIPNLDVAVWEIEHRDPQMILLEEEEKKRLNRALHRLQPHYREVINLFYRFGHSGAEIAESLGEAAGTIRTRLVRARANLRKAYKDDK